VVLLETVEDNVSVYYLQQQQLEAQ